MCAAPSFDDLFTIGKAEMLIRRPDLFLAPGDVTDFLMAAAAAMADKNTQFAAEEFRKTFVDGATGDDLTSLANDHFAITRSPATPAQGTVEFSRLTSAAGAGTLSAGTTLSTIEDETGQRQEYTIDADAVFSGAALGPIAVAATAVDVGRDGNAIVDAITNIVDAVFDPTITVTNPLAFAGGNDEETDEQLRERIRAFPNTLRRGTLAALEFGALTVAAVRVATAIEDATTGAVTVFVTDASGGSTAQMVADVIVALEAFRCAGSIVTVTGGSVLTQAIDISLTLLPGTDEDEIFPDIQTAITERLSKLPVGDGTATALGVLRIEIIQCAAIFVDPDRILGVDVNTPSADVVPAIAEVIRAGAITKT